MMNETISHIMGGRTATEQRGRAPLPSAGAPRECVLVDVKQVVVLRFTSNNRNHKKECVLAEVRVGLLARCHCSAPDLPQHTHTHISMARRGA